MVWNIFGSTYKKPFADSIREPLSSNSTPLDTDDTPRKTKKSKIPSQSTVGSRFSDRRQWQERKYFVLDRNGRSHLQVPDQPPEKRAKLDDKSQETSQTQSPEESDNVDAPDSSESEPGRPGLKRRRDSYDSLMLELTGQEDPNAAIKPPKRKLKVYGFSKISQRVSKRRRDSDDSILLELQGKVDELASEKPAKKRKNVGDKVGENSQPDEEGGTGIGSRKRKASFSSDEVDPAKKSRMRHFHL